MCAGHFLKHQRSQGSRLVEHQSSRFLCSSYVDPVRLLKGLIRARARSSLASACGMRRVHDFVAYHHFGESLRGLPARIDQANHLALPQNRGGMAKCFDLLRSSL